jgi:PAS domain S-box-containing protein
MTRVLILDDRPINRQFLTTLLAYKQIETREAANGLEGLKVASEWPPDLAIVDIAMPVMDGVEFVRRLHAEERFARTPIIFYTASYEASEARAMAAECGAEVLIKPSEPEVILEAIDKALGRPTPAPAAQPAEPAAGELARLHTAAMRTSALVDFQLEIAAQRSAADILRILVRSARNVVASAHSVVTVGEHTFTSCAGAECGGHSGAPHIRVSLDTAKRSYGWLSLMDRKGADGYDADDERIAQTIGAQAAIAYENLVLYEEVQREAEKHMRVARERQVLIESTAQGIFTVDVNQRCTMVNRVAAVLFGRSIDALVGSRIDELVHDHKSGGACGILATLVTRQPLRLADELFCRLDGTSFPVECMASPLVDDGVLRGAVVTFTDVTERRKLERRVEQANHIDSLGRMAATIAHEFNNVLMGIQPFAEVIHRKAGNDAALQKAAGHIMNSVTRGKTITQDILRISRAAEPQTRSIELIPWLEQLVSEIRVMVGVRVNVELDVPAWEKLYVRCDPSQMQQVLTNLALNARDAMGGNGTLRIAAERAGTMVRMMVIDSGCGIAAETLPYIFEPLFTTKHSGTGLGLAVAQQIVVRNAGTITVESTVGVGTRFHIELTAVSARMPSCST